jgi:hypothetical protein
MPDSNPYAAPKANVGDAPETGAMDSEELRRVASGQRLMILSIVVSFLSIPLQKAIGPFATLIGVVATIVAIVGAVRLAGGLGRSMAARILYGIAMIIPLVNLICMLILSSQATKVLRAGGWTVGFFGAREN